MTAIVALHHESVSVVAADRRAVLGGVARDAVRKVHRHACGIIYAVSGSPRMIQIVGDALDRFHGDDIPARELERAISDEFVQLGWRPNHEDGAPPYRDAAALLCDGRGVFEIEPTGFVIRHEGYAAQGSGAPHAYAALYMTRDALHDPRGRAISAIETASALSPGGCGGGVNLEVLLGPAAKRITGR